MGSYFLIFSFGVGRRHMSGRSHLDHCFCRWLHIHIHLQGRMKEDQLSLHRPWRQRPQHWRLFRSFPSPCRFSLSLVMSSLSLLVRHPCTPPSPEEQDRRTDDPPSMKGETMTECRRLPTPPHSPPTSLSISALPPLFLPFLCQQLLRKRVNIRRRKRQRRQ